MWISFPSRGAESLRGELIYKQCHRQDGGLCEGDGEQEEDEANYASCRDTQASPGLLKGGLSKCNSPMGEEEMQQSRGRGERQTQECIFSTKSLSLNLKHIILHDLVS